MAIDANQAAASSTAAIEAPAEQAGAQPEAPRTVNTFTDAERADWLKTGKAPQAPKKEESATSTESSEAADEADENLAPASDAGNQPQGHKPGSKAQTRIKELLAENKRLKEAQAKAPSTEKPAAESSTAAQSAPKKALEAPTKPARPNFKDFENKPIEAWEAAENAYQDAYDKYVDELTDYKANKALADKDAAESQRKASEALSQQVNEAKTRYADFDDVIKPTISTFTGDKEIPQAVVQVANSSDVFPDLMYVLGQNKEDLQKFIDLSKRDPGKAILYLGKVNAEIEARLEKGKGGKPAGQSKRAENGQFTASEEEGEEQEEIPVKTVTSRGAPTREVGGTNSTPPDEVGAAVKSGNFSDFQARQNARDLARTKR